MTEIEPEILTVTEAGKLLNLGETKAHQLASKGVIPWFRTPYHRGRVVRRADVVAIMEEWAKESGLTVATTSATPREARRSLASKKIKK